MTSIAAALVNGFLRLRRGEDGQTLIEYALLGTLIGVVCVVLMFVIGFDLQEVFDELEEVLGFDQGDTTVPSSGDEDAEPSS